MIEYIITAVFVAAIFIIHYANNSRNYWRNRGVYQIKTPWPLGGMKYVLFLEKSFGEVFVDDYKHLRANNQKYGGTYLFTKPVLVVADPEIIKQITTTNFHSFNSHASFVDEENQPLTANIFDVEGARWRKLRTGLTPAFTTGKLKMMFQIMKHCSTGIDDVLSELYESGRPVDIKDVFSRFTTDVVGNCAFGLDCNSLRDPNNEFKNHTKNIFDKGRMIFLKAGLLTAVSSKIAKFLNLKLINVETERFFCRVVDETIKYRQENNVFRGDLMDLLIQLKNEGKITANEDLKTDGEDCKLTDNELRAQAFIFFLGGFETSSTTMTMAIYELGMNQDIQDKLRSEIKTVLETHNGDISYDSIANMKYLDRVLNETLRRHTPVPTTPRACVREFKVPGTNLTIEKDTFIRIPLHGLHMDPEYFPDPEKFEPDRFLEDIKPYTYLPFGEGPRICIGLRFGLLQSKIGLLRIIKDYRVTINEKTIHPLEMDPDSLLTSVKGGVWLNLEKIPSAA